MMPNGLFHTWMSLQQQQQQQQQHGEIGTSDLLDNNFETLHGYWKHGRKKLLTFLVPLQYK
jgi:hypothetical protein